MNLWRQQNPDKVSFSDSKMFNGSLFATLFSATFLSSLVSSLPTPDQPSSQVHKRYPSPTMTVTYFYSNDCSGPTLNTMGYTPYPFANEGVGCYTADSGFAGSMTWSFSSTEGQVSVKTYADDACGGDPVGQAVFVVVATC